MLNQISDTDQKDKEIKVLIIDDSEDDVFLIARALKQGNIQCDLVHIETLDELQRQLDKHSWDIIISDHHMVGFSSAEVLALIQHHDIDLPVIIVSGEIEEEKAIRAMHFGVRDFVMKDNLKRLIPAILREIKQHEVKKTQQRMEEEQRFLRYHDNLTNLVNRREFETHLERFVTEARHYQTTHYLLFLDLDQFKLINDTCGHIAGDDLLIKISSILKTCIREKDTLARIGGDEFGILLQDCDKEAAWQTANKILQSVNSHRFMWQGKTFQNSISIGMTEINEFCADYHEALSCADVACYAAKDRGRNGLVCFSPNDKEYARRRSEMQWAPKIKQAAEEDNFVMFYQPMANLQSQTGSHLEFLVRLREGEKLIGPGAFIPAAERYNLMHVIDRWVIRHVFAYLSNGAKNLQNESTYFINLSGSTLSDGNFFADVKRLQEQFAINPQSICFEITETAAIDNLVDAIQFIIEARKQGFKFALDDFGVGLSSFSYLKSIPVDYLKIDGSFVRNMLESPIDKSIVEACHNIAHAAGLQTVAEFVENSETRLSLQRIGVDFAQGYGIVKPKPLPDIAFLHKELRDLNEK